ncbi:MAG: HU family DNA-binding protein [Bacteroidales bacterium]|nr:HU family DNA-binding protein [Bacteroidales bacterium]
MPVKNKISLQELAEFMTAADETLDKKTCEAFARTLFEVVEEALLSDKFVKVKGFGTFKLVAVSDRESVNINTGERFQIEGHTKVSFIPDNTLKEEINRPFAHFETIDLSDETEQAELDAIDAAAAEEALENEEAEETVEEVAEEMPADELAEEVVEEEAKEEVPEDVLKEEPVEEAEEPMEEPVATEPQTIVTAEKKEEEPAKAEEPAADTTLESEKAPEPEAEEQEEAPTALPVSYEYTEQPPRRPFNWWKAIGVFFFVLTLMLLSYFAGYYRLLCPCIIGLPEWTEPQPVQPAAKVQPAKTAPAKPQPAPAETTAPKISENPLNSENPEQPESRRSKPAKPDPAPRKQQSAPAEVAPAPPADTTVATQPHTVARGETLYSIARKYYGSDKYVNVIIRHNRIKNPNNIEKGTTLQIPILDTGN